MSEPVAAIDCGTNTVRLLISQDGRELVRRAVVTGIGVGVSANKRFNDDAVTRTLEVLREYKELLDQHQVEKLRVVATQAAREAKNRQQFFDQIENILGQAPELLSGEEEGELTFIGATADFDRTRGPFCVIDLGGGSTEFAIGTDKLEAVMSTEMGSVRFTEAYIEHDPPWATELYNCISLVEAHTSDVLREMPQILDVATFIGVAGTITTMASVELGSSVDDREITHHLELTREAAEDVYRNLVVEPLADRIHNPGLPVERAEVIVAGATILVAIMRNLSMSSIVVSEHDLLDGLIASLA